MHILRAEILHSYIHTHYMPFLGATLYSFKSQLAISIQTQPLQTSSLPEWANGAPVGLRAALYTHHILDTHCTHIHIVVVWHNIIVFHVFITHLPSLSLLHSLSFPPHAVQNSPNQLTPCLARHGTTFYATTLLIQWRC